MNLRHVLRVNTRLALQVTQAARDCLSDDLEESLIIATVTAANAGRLDDAPEMALAFANSPYPPEMRRPIRIQRVAESLGIPRETTRTKVQRLVDAGLLQRTTGGLVTPIDSMVTARLAPMFQRQLQALSLAVERLAVLEAGGVARHEQLAANSDAWGWAAVRIVIGHALRGIADVETYIRPCSVMQAYLFLAIVDHAGAHFSASDPILYPHHADYPPVSERRSITASALAAELRLPRETVRRNLMMLAGRGLVTHSTAGFGLPLVESAAERRADRDIQLKSTEDMIRMTRKLRHVGALVAIPLEGRQSSAA